MTSRGTLVFRGGRFWGTFLYSIPIYVTRSFSYISNKILSFSDSVNKSKNSLSNMKNLSSKMKNKTKKVSKKSLNRLNNTKKNV
jgi:hypothetical protein